MTRSQLIEQIQTKKSYLCVGLDTDITKIPKHLLTESDPVFTFNKEIIDATKDLCVAYKINTAFYEALGLKGWEAMEKTVHYIGDEHFKIAEAKRGDIGNTSDQYAKAFFEIIELFSVAIVLIIKTYQSCTISYLELIHILFASIKSPLYICRTILIKSK